MSNPILVLGATGKTGKRVLSRLLKMNLPVRIGSRNANPPFDWESPETWDEALKNVKTIYLTYQPDLAVPGAVAVIQRFVEKCVKSGVQKVVLLSGRGEEECEHCERIVMESSLDWTFLRASFFYQNFSEGFFLDSILAGHLVLPKTNALEPFVDADDIADVATAALTLPQHSKKIYELTGPRLISFEQAVAEISKGLNRPIQFQEVRMEEYTSMLESYQVPEDLIWLMQYLFTEVMDGRNQHLENGVEQALGRKPTDFSQYVQSATQSGFWNVTKTIV